MLRNIHIKTTSGDYTLAQGLESQAVLKLEGNWYFDPAAVDMQYLKVTDRTYTCPHKGVCLWLDLDAPDHQAKDVGWVYTIVKPNYEYIKDRIAFYGGSHTDTREA